MDEEFINKIRGILSSIGLFIVLFISINTFLWVVWNQVMPELGIAKLEYWEFTGLYILVRGMITPFETWV